MEEYRGSGLNKSEFCRGKGISRATFHVWNEVLAEEERGGKFISVSVCDGQKERCEEEIRSAVSIEIEKGVRVEFREGCRFSEIRAIMGVLRC